MIIVEKLITKMKKNARIKILKEDIFIILIKVFLRVKK
jgi:hypothetical protein